MSGNIPEPTSAISPDGSVLAHRIWESTFLSDDEPERFVMSRESTMPFTAEPEQVYVPAEHDRHHQHHRPARELSHKRFPEAPLHNLCGTCKDFTRNCHLLDLLQHADDSAFEGLTLRDTSDYIICTVAQLLDGRLRCHMCTLILRAWKVGRKEDPTAALDPSDRVNLHMRLAGSPRQIVVSVRSEYDKPTRSRPIPSRLRIFATDNDYEDADPPLLKWDHVPLRSSDNIELVKGWLRTCREGHTKCNLFARHTASGTPGRSSRHVGQGSNRPTRVLDVSDGGVKLRCDLEDDFEYLTLSHMWGPDPAHQLRLNLDTLEEFQDQVPYEKLSKIFKEAIRMTRALDYRYIWIDSLCIIQDSKPDWEKEAARMATVYGNSECTLAFVYPPQENFPKPRSDPRGFVPCILRQGTRSSRGLYLSLSVSKVTVDWLQPKTWPLFNRAWVFQERILSSRNLYYGNQAMVWECCELFCDELVGTTSTALDTYTHGTEILSKTYLHSTIMKILALPTKLIAKGPRTEEIASFMDVWTGAVDEYRHMHLTKFEDRVIAFTGIAQAIQNLSGFVYVAGLWRDFLPLCLLWGFKQSGNIREPGVETAPSWSWFAVPIRQESDMVDFSSPFEKSKAARREVYCAKFISIGTDLVELLPKRQPVLIDFKGLTLSIEAITLPAELLWITNDTGNLAMLKIPALTKINETFDLTYYHDDTVNLSEVPKDVLEKAIVATIAHFVVEDEPGTPAITHHVAGLVLIPASEADTWRRIGLWRIKDGDRATEGKPLDRAWAPKRFGEWKKSELTLV
ncbi:heterokaryon incompatibility protein-domain-containing protein [Lophiotrema nucula]|uniref:Heterokaryon incompatibility protein-domain-containing protein n=1 Tax=Lophiotrema nucula TaxID=690887 RepID=A0A6A5Z1M5_9PLEO|nr:heterokaryon incompatibility protein-domain-containing protein [Lophiotrema nucula]